MSHPLLRPLLALACAASLCVPAAASSLLVNASFENPTTPGGNKILPGGSTFVSGWTTVLTGVEHFDATPYGGAYDGTMVVDLANYVYASGGIEQTVATTAGQTYALDFASGNLKNFGRDGTGVVRVSVDGSLLASVDTPTATGTSIQWGTHSLSFTAAGPTTTLRFWNDQNANTHFAFIDAVTLAPVPEPASAALLLSGAMVLAGLARRRGCSAVPAAAS